MFLLVHREFHSGGKNSSTNGVYTYPVISLSMTIFCRPVDRLLLGRLGEPTRSVGDATGAPVGFVRAAFTSRRIRAKGPSLVTVL